jgi:hypothetical protein
LPHTGGSAQWTNNLTVAQANAITNAPDVTSSRGIAFAPTTTKTQPSNLIVVIMTKLLIEADPTRGVRVNAADIAQPFRDDIQRRVKELQAKGEGTGVSTEARVGHSAHELH